MLGELPNVSTTFDEDKFFDLWMLVHILSGVGLGLLFAWLQWSRSLSYVYVLLILSGWEVLELIFGVVEATSNKVLDIVLAFIAFICVYEYFRYKNSVPSFNQFVMVGIPLIMSTVLGWFKYIQRSLS